MSEGKLSKHLDAKAVAEQTFCVCQTAYDGRLMIECDGCNDWFHPSCVGITLREDGSLPKKMKEFICPVCLRDMRVEEEEKQKKRKVRQYAIVYTYSIHFIMIV